MINKEWMSESPCSECCRKANDPDKSLCRLYAYDIDCVYMARYEGYREGQKRLLEHIVTVCYDYDKPVYEEMLKQLRDQEREAGDKIQ